MRDVAHATVTPSTVPQVAAGLRLVGGAVADQAGAICAPRPGQGAIGSVCAGLGLLDVAWYLFCNVQNRERAVSCG